MKRSLLIPFILMASSAHAAAAEGGGSEAHGMPITSYVICVNAGGTWVDGAVQGARYRALCGIDRGWIDSNSLASTIGYRPTQAASALMTSPKWSCAHAGAVAQQSVWLKREEVELCTFSDGSAINLDALRSSPTDPDFFRLRKLFRKILGGVRGF